MIQRVQSIYLLAVFLLLAVVSSLVSIWAFEDSGPQTLLSLLSRESLSLKLIPVLYYVGAVLSLISIFLFRNRRLQFVLGRITILINLILLGALIYLSLTLSGETTVSEKGIGMFIPVVAILLLVLANKAIKRDEDLVKSVDRLR